MKDFIYIFIITTLLGLLCLGYVDRRNQTDVYEQNLKAANSELDSIRLENGSLLASRDLYISKVDELEKRIGLSKKEIRRLEKELEGRITEVAKTEIEIDSPKDSLPKDSVSLPLKIPLTVGFTDNNKFFIKSDYPNIRFNYLEGSRTDRPTTKPKRFGISIQGGLYTGYDIGSRRLYYGPGIGIGFHFRLL